MFDKTSVMIVASSYVASYIIQSSIFMSLLLLYHIVSNYDRYLAKYDNK